MPLKFREDGVVAVGALRGVGEGVGVDAEFVEARSVDRAGVAKWAGHSPQVCLGTYAYLFDTLTERIDPDHAIRAARYGTAADAKRAAG